VRWEEKVSVSTCKRECGTGAEDRQREEFTGLCSNADGGGEKGALSVTLAWPQRDNSEVDLIR
jgi:hypothetical protein